LVTYNDRDKFEKAVVDLGLNIKNFVKKQHIPDYVRFVADQDNLADNQYDDYNHNQHARGARHVRKHWEYSQECFDTIKEYYEKFRLIFDGLIKSMKVNRQIVTLKDMFGKTDLDEYSVVLRIKEALAWIEKQPLSHMPFVEMGFDALH
jgi:Xrn1 SH3-like domain